MKMQRTYKAQHITQCLCGETLSRKTPPKKRLIAILTTMVFHNTTTLTPLQSDSINVPIEHLMESPTQPLNI